MQCVFSGSNTSEHLTTNLGVPQGSVLGPLLFCLYVNDLKHRIDENSTLPIFHIFYADDLQVYIQVQIDQVLDGLEILLQAGKRVTTWAENAGLNLNVKKTQAIFIGSSRYVQRLQAMKLSGVRLSPNALLLLLMRLKI